MMAVIFLAMRFPKITPRFRRIAIVCVLLAALAIGAANYFVITGSRERLYATAAELPANEVGLVLGTSPRLADGRVNLHFESRMDAAAELYRTGKVRHLLVSGASDGTYDEPTAMKKALVVRGVPAAVITCDYAGFRTLDSVVRAHRIFGLSRMTIITQRFHNTRALAIARHEGIGAIGFCSPDVNLRDSFRAEAREVLARTWVVLDLYVWHRGPRLLGPAEPIVVATS